jgi:hypothetical protein
MEDGGGSLGGVSIAEKPWTKTRARTTRAPPNDF